MDTGRFPGDLQVDLTAWREVRICSFCRLGLIQLCQNTTTPNYGTNYLGPSCLFHFHCHGWKSGCFSKRVVSGQL